MFGNAIATQSRCTADTFGNRDCNSQRYTSGGRFAQQWRSPAHTDASWHKNLRTPYSSTPPFRFATLPRAGHDLYSWPNARTKLLHICFCRPGPWVEYGSSTLLQGFRKNVSVVQGSEDIFSVFHDACHDRGAPLDFAGPSLSELKTSSPKN